MRESCTLVVSSADIPFVHFTKQRKQAFELGVEFIDENGGFCRGI
jgi:hypothetical protein